MPAKPGMKLYGKSETTITVGLNLHSHLMIMGFIENDFGWEDKFF